MNKIIMEDFGLTCNSCHGGFQVALQLFLDVTFRCFKKGMSGLGVMTSRPLMHGVRIYGHVGIVYISTVPVHVLKKRMGVLWLSLSLGLVQIHPNAFFSGKAHIPISRFISQ